jgi:hypothetical protein
MNNPIQVWFFKDAPNELKRLSSNGCETFVALIPPCYENQTIDWLESNYFGSWEVRTYKHPILKNYTVKIGSN